MKYNKLVRDNIPQIIEESGKKANYRVLSVEEFKKALKEKLVEEANELLRAETKEEMVAELGDVFEVIVALIHEYQIPDLLISHTQHTKLNQKGGFDKRYFLESVEEL